MANEKSIKVLNAGLDESPLRGGSIIMRGVIDANSLVDLQVDDYQREAMQHNDRSRLMQALKGQQPLPDIELGMRGERYINRNDAHYMQDPMFIIDGLQRVSAAIRYMQLNPGLLPRIGATIHFATNRTWERHRFEVLNIARVKVSPNIILRNRREDHDVLRMLYDLTHDASNFALYQRVGWSQNMKRTELLTALMLFKTLGYLHMHTASGMIGGNVEDSMRGSDALKEAVGINNLKQNLMAFYNVIDNAWGVRAIQYRDVAPQLKGTFLFVLARLFSDHVDFWRSGNERQFFVNVDLQAKLKGFKIFDPAVQNLASSSGKSRILLYTMLVDHINSGKRTRRLTLRDKVDHSDFERAEAA